VTVPPAPAATSATTAAIVARFARFAPFASAFVEVATLVAGAPIIDALRRACAFLAAVTGTASILETAHPDAGLTLLDERRLAALGPRRTLAALLVGRHRLDVLGCALGDRPRLTLHRTLAAISAPGEPVATATPATPASAFATLALSTFHPGGPLGGGLCALGQRLAPLRRRRALRCRTPFHALLATAPVILALDTLATAAAAASGVALAPFASAARAAPVVTTVAPATAAVAA
jgi:hypothetical protein